MAGRLEMLEQRHRAIATLLSMIREQLTALDHTIAVLAAAVRPDALGTIRPRGERFGRRLTKGEMTAGTTLYVGATESNNGITARIGQNALHPGGQFTVSYNGSVAEALYQPAPFWASDDVNVLYPRFRMTQELGLFLATLIRLEKYRYNYGRKWLLDVMKRSTLLLPVDSAGVPDWKQMESIVRACPSFQLLAELN